jgi:Putative MetA-pathway of phenol degradation
MRPAASDRALPRVSFSMTSSRRSTRPRGRRRLAALALTLMALVAAGPLAAQENYEIQVYGSDVVTPGRTMFELHTNYTANGRRTVDDGVFPTQHALHETVEITHGFTPWAEVGWYIFTSVQSGGEWNWVGDHIRPRVAAPESWHWPVGASLSFEVGYQRPEFSADTWTLEIRPIIDKQWGRVYGSFNPTLGRSFKGPGVASGVDFEPNAAVTVDVTPRVNLGVEYYGAMGSVTGFDPAAQQEHQVFPAVNLNLSPNFEFNFGVGFGLTSPTDKTIVKMITGWRF